MIDDLETRRLHYFLGPMGKVTKIKFDHMTTGFTDDVVMMILQLTEFVSHLRSMHRFEKDSKRFEKIERPIDGG
jgi:hypothetical protein